eukprot:CAMPEP_0172390586 /NCGR_PEP_ID=MMETSP1061-20121228/7202_1 /TAXON_ID=37318 /ORGANISM="Pseudo-nitzschia pungens, Strain cf. pungens" /LENGTH=207 /DNA_ID=CAMNT_0013121007 /DNA_START=660 /DNA_END=1284 /DNA_ORIENTATION=-
MRQKRKRKLKQKLPPMATATPTETAATQSTRARYYYDHPTKGITKRTQFALILRTVHWVIPGRNTTATASPLSATAALNSWNYGIVRRNDGFPHDLFGWEGCRNPESRWKTTGVAKFEPASEGSETVEAVASKNTYSSYSYSYTDSYTDSDSYSYDGILIVKSSSTFRSFRLFAVIRTRTEQNFIFVDQIGRGFLQTDSKLIRIPHQ